MHQIRLRATHDSLPVQGGVITIGNFDGIHRGHQQLLLTTVKLARAAQVAAIVLTFEPYAEEFFQRARGRIQQNNYPPVAPARLTSLREKICLLIKYQIDYVIVLPFNARLAQTKAVDFINAYLIPLQPIHLIVGDDFRFGSKRQGDVNLLSASGQRLGFQVGAGSTLIADGCRISSTRVRALLAAGAFVQAAQLLGRPYTMVGRVIPGNRLGRELGFPTANLSLGRSRVAIQGIFAVRVLGLGDAAFYGAASIGLRPAIGGKQVVFEVHILDFGRDIYGMWLQIEFGAKLRDENYYPSLAELKRQIAQDVENVRLFFSQNMTL